MLIRKRQRTSLNYSSDSIAFIEYSNDTEDIYKNVETYNTKNKKMLIIFRDMTADMFNNKKRNLILTEFFIKGRKHVSLIFITAILFRCSEKY